MTQRFTFANYSFDSHSGLQYKGQPVHLPPKERGLLYLLVSLRGKVVGKDELVAKVWGGNETSDESISRTVYRLRIAMQGSGGPEVVETVYNAGFRISAPVRVGSMEASPTLNAITQSGRPGAVCALLSAREFLARRTAQDVDAAAQAARKAISLDPGFAAAWSMLAEIRVFQAQRLLRPPREAGWLALQAAHGALASDPHAAPALAVRGWTRVLVEHAGNSGLADLDWALGLDDECALVHRLRGAALQALGQNESAVAMMRRALELNPVCPSANATLAYYLLLAAKADEALVEARALARRFATIDSAQAIASVVCSVHGLHPEALAYGRRARELAPDTPAMHAALGSALAHAGQKAQARDVLSAIEDARLPQPSACCAAIYLALNEREHAVALLLDAYERGLAQFACARDDPRYHALRGDPVLEPLWQRAFG